MRLHRITFNMQIRILRIRHHFNTGKSFLYGRNRQHDEGEDGLRADIGAVVDQGVNRSAHAVVCGIVAEEDHSGQKGEKESAENSEEIAFDQPVLLVAENTGEPQCAESEKVVGEHLGDADDVGIHHKLQNAVSRRRHQSGAQTEPITDQADEQHAEQSHGAAVRQIKQFQVRSDHGEGYGDGTEGKLFCIDGFFALLFPYFAGNIAASDQE